MVPRCRTRMEPPLTISPPKRFTPRRCAFESRPFLELPNPFLCAMTCLCHDLAHPHRGVVLAVADGALVLLLTFELKDDDLIAAAVLHDGALHLRRAERFTGDQLIGIAHYSENPAQFNFGADITGDRVHPDDVAGSDAILLSTCFDYGVHNVSLSECFRAS